jgi:NAD(P)H dehydrogenase (quinone)
LITWSEHIVFAYPTYWALPPPLLTLFIDVIITSGFAFKYHKPILGKIPRWDRLLKGRTATILSTMDSPPIFMELHDRDPGGKMMKDVLRFTGVKLRRKHYFGSVVLSPEE